MLKTLEFLTLIGSNDTLPSSDSIKMRSWKEICCFNVVNIVVLKYC